jgi:hypothetical protein
VVALGQLVGVHALGFSRWRGGGMGMYSEHHPNRTEVWTVRGDRAVPAEDLEVCRSEAWQCTRMPTTRCLEGLLVCLDDDVTRVEAWRPQFSPADRVWSMREVAHAGR